MSDYRILLVGRKDRIPSELPARLRRPLGHEIDADVVGAAGEAVRSVTAAGYDAVLCWTETDHELATVIRLRKARPDLPILVLSSHEDEGFKERAKVAGATRVAAAAPDPDRLAGYIRSAVESGDLLREVAERSRQAQSTAGDLHGLARKARVLSGKARATASKPAVQFLPLLVEDEDDYAALMLRALDEAGIATSLPVLKSGQEAIKYLSVLQPSGQGKSSPVPTILLLDVTLPDQSGFDVLAWIRRRPELKRLPVVMFTVHAEPESIGRAYELGANSYLVKPKEFKALVELVSGLQRFWGMAGRVFEI